MLIGIYSLITSLAVLKSILANAGLTLQTEVNTYFFITMLAGYIYLFYFTMSSFNTFLFMWRSKDLNKTTRYED